MGNDSHHEQVLVEGLSGVEGDLVLQDPSFRAVHQVRAQVMPSRDSARNVPMQQALQTCPDCAGTRQRLPSPVGGVGQSWVGLVVLAL